MQRYKLPAGSAERIALADLGLFMRIEELELPATAKIELNTAPDGEPATWQTLEALSTGQKATAVLLLLLLESEAPLVVDQPEDDLDNRFITEGVVPIILPVAQHDAVVAACLMVQNSRNLLIDFELEIQSVLRNSRNPPVSRKRMAFGRRCAAAPTSAALAHES